MVHRTVCQYCGERITGKIKKDAFGMSYHPAHYDILRRNDPYFRINKKVKKKTMRNK